MHSIIKKLAGSSEPVIIAKLNKYVLGATDEINIKLSKKVKNSQRVKKLLSIVDYENSNNTSPYQKFYGTHWLIATLADNEYPIGDKSIEPIVTRVCDYWLTPNRIKETHFSVKKSKYKSIKGVPIIDGRARRCASQQGNALYSAVKLGFSDKRCDKLAQLLIRWQWPDGGWNCDKNFSAKNSSFMETLLPIRGLHAYGALNQNQDALDAARRGAEIFLKRQLYKRVSNSTIIKEDFIKLHYPCYWHYDILFGLKVLSELGLISDPRCGDALDLLESKRLEDGGFPAEKKYYRHSDTPVPRSSLVNWGGVNKRKYNEFITVDALRVLKAAGRI